MATIFDQLMDDEWKLEKGTDFADVPRFRQQLDEAGELKTWRRYAQWHAKISPRCKFTPKGIANIHERRRRFTLFAMFRLFDFRSGCEEVKTLFTSCLGQMSLQWVATSIDVDMPPHYYEWILQQQPSNLKTWGDVTIERLSRSDPHLEMLRRHRPNVINRYYLKKVHGS